MVLAGAGSGKTRVLTNRIAHIVTNLGVPGYNVLAITFTNKATREMQARLDKLLGPDNNVWVHTFHKFCSIILRKHAEKIGFTSSFSIFDEDDSNKVIARILKQEEIDYISKEEIKHKISNAKQKGISAERYAAINNDASEESRVVSEVFVKYQNYLKNSNSFDYDDMLVYTYYLLTDFPEVGEYYQDKFKYIHVDEFQDTNKIQNDIIEVIASKWKNIFVVGDDDQCIYRWRGAEIENILCFDKVFTDVKKFLLQENYRSTPNILNVANNLICHNTKRHLKELVPNRKNGVRVEYMSAYNDLQEAQQIASNIYSLKSNLGYVNSDFAVLVRESRAANSIENKIREAGFGYRVLGGYKFYERKEIQDMVAYLRIISNENDNAALLRIVNYPTRGIGTTLLGHISAVADRENISLYKAASLIVNSEDISLRGKKDLVLFVEMMNRLFLLKNSSLVSLIEAVIEEIAIKQELEKGFTKEESETRYDNILYLVEQARQYQLKNPQSDLVDFIQLVTLAPETKEIDMEGTITISTIHAVKGLEFPVVFIAACEEGIIPSQQSISAEEVEEERRLMYVAITRAKDRLYVSKAVKRFRYGKEEFNMPSRFISEMNPASSETAFSQFGRSVEIDGKDIAFSDKDYGYNGSCEKASEAIRTIKNIIHSPNIYNESIFDYVKGSKVNHKRYGDGVIILLTGEGEDVVASIEFPDLGVKKFVIKNTPMTLIK